MRVAVLDVDIRIYLKSDFINCLINVIFCGILLNSSKYEGTLDSLIEMLS